MENPYESPQESSTDPGEHETTECAKPPIFLWKDGTLDVFDALAEIEDRFDQDGLPDSNSILCDSEGNILVVGRTPDDSISVVIDESRSPSPDTLRTMLRGYLERKGLLPEEIDAMSPSELVAKAAPPMDPRVANMEQTIIGTILFRVVVTAIALLALGLFYFIHSLLN